MFDVRRSSVFFSIRVGTFQGSGGSFKPDYLLEPAVTRVFIQAHPVMLKIFITGAVSQKTAKPSAWTIDHIPMGRFNKLTRGLFREFIHLLRIFHCSGIVCMVGLFWMSCAGNQKDHRHYRQPIFHTLYLYPDEPGELATDTHRRTRTMLLKCQE